MNVFIVNIENETAKRVAKTVLFNSKLNANDIYYKRLRRKAMMKNGLIIINDINELYHWYDALDAYDITKSNEKRRFKDIYYILRKSAETAMNNRLNNRNPI